MAHTESHDPGAIPEFAIDPVCGMKVSTSESSYRSEHEGKMFYFCCAGCKQTFDGQKSKQPVLAYLFSRDRN